MHTTRINIWSSPRNISTAFMYAWAQRLDCTVVDEPLYAHYLRVSGLLHPGREEVLNSQDSGGERVVREVLMGDYSTNIVFFKQMTHHLVDLDWKFMLGMQNVLFIRNPRAIIASYAKVIPRPTIQDVGIRKQVMLYNFLKENGQTPFVLDSKSLLLNPEVELRRLCTSLGISFSPSMLHWEAGARPEDGIWAKHWYHNVHQSTGFRPYIEREIVLPPHLETLADECLPYYKILLENKY